jgi:DNA polymerase I
MKIVFADCETDGLNPTKIHCICVKTLDGFEETYTDMKAFTLFVELYQPDRWVFHNGLGFDVWAINKLVGPLINPMHVVDTFVVSKLVNYQKFTTHSLEELGRYLGVHKGNYVGGWDTCTEEMLEYCKQDVNVLEAIFNHYKQFIVDKSWAKAMRVEHDMAMICQDMTNNGFYFDKPTAENLLNELTSEMQVIEDNFKTTYPAKLVEANRLKNRYKADGTPYATIETALAKYPLTKVEGDELVCFDYKDFNPNSPKDRIDVLWDAGWKPKNKTTGYKKFERDARDG